MKSSEALPPFACGGTAFLGELGLDGSLRRINGILPVLISARKMGVKRVVVPYGNAVEAWYIGGIDVYAAKNLREVVAHLTGEAPLAPVPVQTYHSAGAGAYENDLSLVKGQRLAKRALEIAVSGGHNLLFVGPPGTGKTMLARCIPSIMPDLSFEEALEITKIHSVAGVLGEEGIVTRRPFRTPHHTATQVSMCGGGNTKIHPGEISLAHGGVLFLDELPEYTRSTLESLRQPLEDGVITVSRAGGSVVYPAGFMLVASMNPCPCGNYGSDTLPCTCTPAQIKRYRDKISGPLLDRIDIRVEVDAVKYASILLDKAEEDSATVKKRVDTARRIQETRFADSPVRTNGKMGEREIRKFCRLGADSEELLKVSFEKLHLSMRGRARILRVARTIADMDFSEDIQPMHLLEAINFRTMENSD